RVLDALVGANASASTRDTFRKKLRAGELNDKEIEIETRETGMPSFEIPGMPNAQVSMINLGDMFGKAFGGKAKMRRMTVADAHDPLIAEEADKLRILALPPKALPNMSPRLIMLTCAFGMPGISNDGIPVSRVSISISLSFNSPARSFLRNVSRVEALALAPTSASST